MAMASHEALLAHQDSGRGPPVPREQAGPRTLESLEDSCPPLCLTGWLHPTSEVPSSLLVWLSEKHLCSSPSPLPTALGGGLGVAFHCSFPHSVGQGIADGRHDHEKLARPVVQVQGAYAGQVGAQVAMDPGALNAHEGAQVQTCPVRI